MSASDPSRLEQWYDPDSRTTNVRLKLTHHDLMVLGRHRYEAAHELLRLLGLALADHDPAERLASEEVERRVAMLKDGVMLIEHALRGDTEPKFLPSMGAMSHRSGEGG